MMTTNTARVALPSDGSGARFTASGLAVALSCRPNFLVWSAVPIWLAGKAKSAREDHAERYSALVSRRAFEGS